MAWSAGTGWPVPPPCVPQGAAGWQMQSEGFAFPLWLLGLGRGLGAWKELRKHHLCPEGLLSSSSQWDISSRLLASVSLPRAHPRYRCCTSDVSARVSACLCLGWLCSAAALSPGWRRRWLCCSCPFFPLPLTLLWAKSWAEKAQDVASQVGLNLVLMEPPGMQGTVLGGVLEVLGDRLQCEKGLSEQQTSCSLSARLGGGLMRGICWGWGWVALGGLEVPLECAAVGVLGVVVGSSRASPTHPWFACQHSYCNEANF